MKVAIVHEWFDTYAGSEKVLEQILNVYPDADLFAVVDFLPQESRGFIKFKSVTTTFIQNLYKARNKFRKYLPLMPLAIEQLDLSSYDLVISNSHCVAKGVVTGPNQVHISYVHSPMRYAWDLQGQYLKEAGLNKGLKGWLAKIILHYLRIWDVRSSNNVDAFICNSQYIARRIEKCYRREAKVIYPPVAINDFTLHVIKEDFYFTCSRMVPYKKIDLIVEAFSQMPDKKLIVIGDGSEFLKVKAKAGPNVKLLGYQSFAVLKDYMLSFTSYTKIGLRLATIFGFVFSALNMLVALGYFIAKLIWWEDFSMGTAPMLIGIFFTGSVQLFFLGLIGEYILNINTRSMHRPLVVEERRINF